MSQNSNVCIHGQLKRQCQYCENNDLQTENDMLQSQCKEKDKEINMLKMTLSQCQEQNTAYREENGNLRELVAELESHQYTVTKQE